MSNYSPDPGVPQTPTKAYAATGLAFVAGFVAFWIGDKDPFTSKDIGEAALTAAMSAGIIGGATYKVKNKRTRGH
jgi:hypothetical protein